MAMMGADRTGPQNIFASPQTLRWSAGLKDVQSKLAFFGLELTLAAFRSIRQGSSTPGGVGFIRPIKEGKRGLSGLSR